MYTYQPASNLPWYLKQNTNTNLVLSNRNGNCDSHLTKVTITKNCFTMNLAIIMVGNANHRLDHDRWKKLAMLIYIFIFIHAF